MITVDRDHSNVRYKGETTSVLGMRRLRTGLHRNLCFHLFVCFEDFHTELCTTTASIDTDKCFVEATMLNFFAPELYLKKKRQKSDYLYQEVPSLYSLSGHMCGKYGNLWVQMKSNWHYLCMTSQPTEHSWTNDV